MTEKLFAVTFHVRWRQIHGLAQLTPHLTPVSIDALDIEAPSPEPAKKRERKPARESKPGKAVLGWMEEGHVYSLAAIGEALMGAGLARTGAGAIASQLTKAGDIERVADGKYSLPSQGGAL